MRGIERRPIAEQIAERLLSTDHTLALPSCRELAKNMMVSIPSAMAALHHLAERGLIGKDRKTGRYRWLETGMAASRKDVRRLLLISPQCSSAMDTMYLQAIDRLLYQAADQGWETHKEMVSYGSVRKRADERFSAVVEQFQPSRIIVLQGTPQVASWAVRAAVPVLFFGGSVGVHDLPSLGVSMSASLRQLLPRLLATGERHICLPLCGFQDDFIAAFRGAFEQCLGAVGLPYVASYHTPVTASFGPDAMRTLLAPVLQARRPTTVIFTSMRYYLSAQQALYRAGLYPGKNLKVAILVNEPDTPWLDPQPAYFRLPMARVQQRIMQWLNAPGAKIFLNGPLRLAADFVPGCGIA